MNELTPPRHDPTRHDEGTPQDVHPAGGWGSLEGIRAIFGESHASPLAVRVLASLNKPKGVMCTSCAWAKPKKPGVVEFCENGAKATLWELTPNRATPEVFAHHTVSELRLWRDHDLEKLGRLTHPMLYDPATDRYVETTWDEAYRLAAAQLAAIDPKEAVFYSSGHAGLEASYLYQLFARVYGHNNLPQSSNMCHETTSVNLKSFIGVPVGTCTLEDFEHCDAIFFFGQNTGSNSPRFLHPLKDAVKRGCRIVTFNPVREQGLISFADPRSPLQMTVGAPTQMSELYFQVRPGGDIAVMTGMIKHILEEEELAPGTILDHAFIEAFTTGFEATASAIRQMEWTEIEAHSGLTRAMITEAADIYIKSKNVIGIYGMGLTQHVHGWLNLGMLVNFLLLRGNIGRPGTGISPVRGHSNVQGQRTVGIAEKPSLVPLDKMEAMFGFTAPREPGLNIVHAAEAAIEGRVKALISLGGNLLRALPDLPRLEKAWSRLDLSVHISTRLNRSHLFPGRVTLILPCLGRADRDEQASGQQAVSMEDSLSHIYGSIGQAEPPSDQLKSEVAIVAGLAKATLTPNAKLDWDGWTANYDRIRDLIAETWPDQFGRFNERLFEPGGFYRGNAARERTFKTKSGKAEFTAPDRLSSLGVDAGKTGRDPSVMTLITLRSNDQFNTTIYGYNDRLRGLEGSRMIILINRDEIARLNLVEGQDVAVECAIEDGVTRRIEGLRVTAYDLPPGCIAGYYPELNPLVPLAYHEERSQTPAYKGAPVRILAHA